MNFDDDVSLIAQMLNVPLADAERWLARIGGLRGLRDDNGETLEAAGLDETQVKRVRTLVELARRLNALPPPKRAVIATADDAAALVRDMATLTQEHVRVLLVDAHRRWLESETVYIGTAQGTLLRVAEVFRPAMARNAPAFIIAHNHPSGDPAPSPEDIELTRALVAAGRILDIVLLDHLIIGSDGWLSLKEMRLGFD